MAKFNFTLSPISYLYRAYISLVAHTTRFSFEGDYDKNILKNSIIGFWHQDSFGVNFLLKLHPLECSHLNIIVTADRRGDYISNVIEPLGVTALRMPDGARIRFFLQDLKATAMLPEQSICIALDGPLGPYHIPKKLGPMLASTSKKPLVIIGVNYTHHIKLYKRWDKYIVPLPFGKMTFTFYNKGLVEPGHLKNFSDYQHFMMTHIEST